MRKNLYMELLQSATSQINEAQSVEDALQFILRLVCEFTGWPIGHASWIRNDSLVQRHLWYGVKGDGAQRFRRAVESGPSAWSCPLHGTRLVAGEPVWSVNLAAESGCSEAQPAREAGLRSSFFLPLEVVDWCLVLQFYSPMEHEPDEGFMRVIRVLGIELTRTIQRQLDQDALRKNKEQLKLILQSVPAGILIVGRDKKIRWANSTVARMAGFSDPQSLTGHACTECLCTAEKDRCPVLDLGQVVDNSESLFLSSRGQTIPVLKSVMSVHIDHEDVLLETFIDITAQKMAQQSLKESEERFKTISHAALDAIIMIDADGRIIFWNPAAERIFGYRADEVHGRPVHDLLVPERLRAQARAGFERFRKTGNGLAVGRLLELTAVRKDGNEMPIEIAVSGISKGEGWQAIAIIRDITARKQMEGQLAQAQKLEAIGSLAAGIAHEINTPTQYVSDNTSFLSDAFGDLEQLIAAHRRLCGAVSAGETALAECVREAEEIARKIDVGYLLEEIPKSLQQSKEGLMRIAEIVRAMKEFSHPSSKEKRPVDLNQAIRTTVTVARNEWKYVADLSLDLEADLPPVPGLPGEINQTLLNIIVNAAHAIGEVAKGKSAGKGRISVSTRRLEDAAEIRIADTGGGIPEKIRHRIFDPFFTTKGIGKGTGQGLAIARTVVVKHHGGALEFETEEGRGTTFVIRFPLKDPVPQEQAT